MKRSHGMPFGAEYRSDGSVRFRLWAPSAKFVEVLLLDSGKSHSLDRLSEGWYESVIPGLSPGTGYKFRIDRKVEVPDPASRYQPHDVHGASEIIDPGKFEWKDVDWRGRPWEEVVLYELHVGAFSQEGTFAGVERKLDYLADLGVTAIELMPLSDFPGERNWGYDGVLPFAPDSSYGSAEDLKRLVQACHERELMIFLDVVYNHFGPEGNYLHAYAPEFFTSRHKTPWGDAINFDGRSSRAVRQYFIHNALYWLEEFHFDGLRLDAVHAIRDDSEPDILTELAEAVRQRFGNSRRIHLVLENDDNAAHYLLRDDRGSPTLYNAQWNDDVHHALHVLMTGETDGYYSDYAERPVWQLGRCLAEGFAFQGDPSPYRNGELRGEPSRTLPPQCFVGFLQNHDQIGNRAFGERISRLAQPHAIRAATAILLLSPSPPLIFMGEEYGAQTPFLFFCDFGPELATAVTEGRRKEFARFARFQAAETRTQIPDPSAESTFAQSKLDWNEVQAPAHSDHLEFVRQLLKIRKENIVPLLPAGKHTRGEFELFGQGGLLVHWDLANVASLTLLANLQSHPTGFERMPVGQLIFEWTGKTQFQQTKEMPPWSVAWFLKS